MPVEPAGVLDRDRGEPVEPRVAEPVPRGLHGDPHGPSGDESTAAFDQGHRAGGGHGPVRARIAARLRRTRRDDRFTFCAVSGGTRVERVIHGCGGLGRGEHDVRVVEPRRRGHRRPADLVRQERDPVLDAVHPVGVHLQTLHVVRHLFGRVSGDPELAATEQ